MTAEGTSGKPADGLTYERFNDRARRVLVLAEEEARVLSHRAIGTEHILLGLIHEGGLAASVLESLDISLQAVREKVDATLPASRNAPAGSLPFAPGANKVLELSLREATQLGHGYVGTEHILLGILREGECSAAQVLVSLGAELSQVRQQVIELTAGSDIGEARPWPYEDSAPGGRSAGSRTAQDEELMAAVGTHWWAEVVEVGRNAAACAKAYLFLAEAATALGIDLDSIDASQMTVSSVETDQGPGLRLVVHHRVAH